MSGERLTSGVCPAHSVIPASENVSLFVIRPSVFVNCHPSKLGSVEQCLSVRGEGSRKSTGSNQLQEGDSDSRLWSWVLLQSPQRWKVTSEAAGAKGLKNIANVH